MTNSSTSPERLTHERLCERVAELEAELSTIRAAGSDRSPEAVRDVAEAAGDGTANRLGAEAIAEAEAGSELERRTLEAILDATEDFVYLFDREGRFTYANRALLDLWGIGLSEAVGKNFHDLGYPHDLAELHRGQIEQVVSTKQPLRASNAYVSRSGRSGEYEYIFAPVIGQDGEVEAIAGVTREVGEIKRSQAESATARARAEAAERRLRTAFDQAPALVALTEGPEHRFVLANPGIEKAVGRGHLPGRTVREVLPEFGAQGIFRVLDRVYATGEPFWSTESRVRWSREQGRTRDAWYNWACQPLLGEDGRVSGILHHAAEVTDQVLAHQAVERANAMLHETEVKLKFALSVADLGVWEFDLVSEEAWRDERHDEIFGYEERPPSWGLSALLRHVVPAHRDHVSAALAGTIQRGEPLGFTCPIVRADGEERWIALHGDAITDARGRPARLIGIVRDITDERKARAELWAAKESAEAANRSKSEFLAVMSHELRTPLNAISGYADLLKMGVHGPVTEAQQKALGRIQYSQQHLLGLINEVLNFAKLESGSVHYDIGDVAMHELLAEVEGLVEPPVRAKGLEFEIAECAPDLTARADPEKLRQIVVNLVSNAIKFTEAGGRIDLSCEVAADDVYVAVQDTGIGISGEKLDTIFDPFVQVRADLTRTAEGAGLGLAISRELAHGMGGDLLVESVPGKGSTFTVRLPATDPAAAGD